MGAKSQSDAQAGPAAAPQAGATFQQFMAEQWDDWLKAYLAYEPHTPALPVLRDEPLHLPLLRLYRRLATTKQRDRLAEAVARCYKYTKLDQVNAEQLYYLLRLIADFKPQLAERLVRQHLLEGALLDVTFGPYALQHLLLVASARYDLDERLVDYIYDSCRRDTDYGYLLLCLDLLATRGGPEAYRFIERLMPAIKSTVEAMQLCMQLRADLPITGYRAFYDWYLSDEESLRTRFPEEMKLFKAALKTLVLRPPLDAWKLNLPAYAVLLSAQLQAEERQLKPEELFAVAAQHKEVGEGVVIEALSDIWRGRVARSQQEEAWSYDSLDQLPQIPLQTPTHRAISVQSGAWTDDDQYVFDAQLEPGIDKVFATLKTKFGGLFISGPIFPPRPRPPHGIGGVYLDQHQIH